jgi:predicted nucleic acid-binding protein
VGTDDRSRLVAELAEYRRVGLDSSGCIYFLRQIQPHASLVRAVLELAASGAMEVELPGIVQAELMYGPYATGRPEDRYAVLAFMEAPGVAVAPITRDVLFASAQIRALTKGQMKLPDALVVASCAIGRCQALIANDRVFRSLDALTGMALMPVPGQRYALPRYLHLDDYAQGEAQPRSVSGRGSHG